MKLCFQRQQTALHMAVESSKSPLVELLLTVGSDLELLEKVCYIVPCYIINYN